MNAIAWAIAVLSLPFAAAHAAAPQAGDPAPVAARCRTGEVGRYEVTEFVDRTTPVSDGHLTQRIDVPQASCFPACKRDQVDSHLYRIQDPAGDELAHPYLHDDDAADAALVPSVALQQIDAATLQLAVRTRGRAHTWYVEADKFKRIITSSKETTASGSMLYNDPFFVVFNHAALPTLVVTLAKTSVQLSPSELDLNLLPSWLVEPIAPQQLGVSTVYTLKVVGDIRCEPGM